jgi:hypothetical protein
LEEQTLLNLLEALARQLGITLRYESVNGEDSSSTGGLCRIKGDYVLIIHSQAPDREKIRLLTEALRQFPLNDIYLKPALRDHLEDRRD